MRVYFQSGLGWRDFPTGLPNEPDLLALSFNNWDDYGSQTTLNATLFVAGERLLDFALKILLENKAFTAEYLTNLVTQGWDGFFPIPNIGYVSVPSDIDFYAALIGKIGLLPAKQVISVIRDAGYMQNIEHDPQALSLIQEAEFESSLLREAGARKAFNDGWMAFEHNQASTINDFTLCIPRKSEGTQDIHFRFNSTVLPYDINLLIGPNGIGKSHCLKSLVEYWLGIESGSKEALRASNHEPFDVAPNISRLILVSYSPFEEFCLDLSEAELLDKSAYRYFGFRQNIPAEDGSVRVGISRNLPASDSAHSLLKAFFDDQKFGFMPNWVNKINVIHDVLQSTIGYEYLALAVTDEYENNLSEIPDQLFIRTDGKSHIKLAGNVLDVADKIFGFNPLSDVDFQRGVVFFKDGQRIDLSSGQRLFCYIVINIAGEIRNNSLVVIDEPELFLHMTLEIKFISLLKRLLKSFNSKAILATHSLAIAREIPGNCVHVFREIEDGLDVVHPPFETFGGDMQRISTYVFGDDSVSKPFDEWIDKKISEYENPKALINALDKEVNEELLIKILNSGVGSGNKS